MVDIMTTNIERNESENEIRKLRKNYEYDEKVSTLLEDEFNFNCFVLDSMGDY